jgi:hypothetical protein
MHLGVQQIRNEHTASRATSLPVWATENADTAETAITPATRHCPKEVCILNVKIKTPAGG